jgi:hypothetical protein
MVLSLPLFLFLSPLPKVHIVSFLYNIFAIFANFFFCKTSFFVTLADSRNSRKLTLSFLKHGNRFRNQFCKIFLNENPIRWGWGHCTVFALEGITVQLNCSGSCEPGSRCRPNECIFGSRRPRGVGILE